MNTEIALRITEILTPLLLALISYMTVRATEWLKSNTDNTFLSGLVLRLDAAVSESLKELTATVVAGIKEASADGVVTPDEAKAIKQKAVDQILVYLGTNTVKKASALLGAESLEQMVKTKIEAYLHDLEIAGAPADTIIPPSE